MSRAAFSSSLYQPKWTSSLALPPLQSSLAPPPVTLRALDYKVSKSDFHRSAGQTHDRNSSHARSAFVPNMLPANPSVARAPFENSAIRIVRATPSRSEPNELPLDDSGMKGLSVDPDPTRLYGSTVPSTAYAPYEPGINTLGNQLSSISYVSSTSQNMTQPPARRARPLPEAPTARPQSFSGAVAEHRISAHDYTSSSAPQLHSHSSSLTSFSFPFSSTDPHSLPFVQDEPHASLPTQFQPAETSSTDDIVNGRSSPPHDPASTYPASFAQPTVDIDATSETSGLSVELIQSFFFSTPASLESSPSESAQNSSHSPPSSPSPSPAGAVYHQTPHSANGLAPDSLNLTQSYRAPTNVFMKPPSLQSNPSPTPQHHRQPLIHASRSEAPPYASTRPHLPPSSTPQRNPPHPSPLSPPRRPQSELLTHTTTPQHAHPSRTHAPAPRPQSEYFSSGTPLPRARAPRTGPRPKSEYSRLKDDESRSLLSRMAAHTRGLSHDQRHQSVVPRISAPKDPSPQASASEASRPPNVLRRSVVLPNDVAVWSEVGVSRSSMVVPGGSKSGTFGRSEADLVVGEREGGRTEERRGESVDPGRWSKSEGRGQRLRKQRRD